MRGPAPSSDFFAALNRGVAHHLPPKPPHNALENLMTEPAYDIVIRGGRVATALRCVRGGCRHRGARPSPPSGRGLPAGKARDRCPRQTGFCPAASTATPISNSFRPAGIMNADTFESATTLGRFRRHHHGDLVCGPACRHGAAAGIGGLSRARQEGARSSTMRSI